MLLTMLEAYKNIGMTSVYLEQIEEIKDKLSDDSLNEDAYYLADLLNLDVKEQRKQLILYKDSTPRNQQEELLLNIKRTLRLIRKDATLYPLNAAELLGYVNHIFGKHKFNYTTKAFTAIENKKVNRKSIRMLINECFDEYDEYLANNKYESIILSITLYLDIINLEPYNGMNGFAGIIGLYYLLIQNKGLKSDNVESTIYKLPEFFTKDDVRRANPNVSDATINRILNKLRDDGVIMPLGTGRSAKWRKNPDNEVPLSRYFGD